MNKPHIHFVLPYNSSAMQQMAAPILADPMLQEAYLMTFAPTADSAADLNYCLPWHPLAHTDMLGQKVMVYTHCNPTDKQLLATACSRADRIVAMSFTGRQELLEVGAAPEKIRVIYPAIKKYPMRARNIGIVGYVQPNGRKREHILVDLAYNLPAMVKQCLVFHIAGSGWEVAATAAQNAGLQIVLRGELDETQLGQFYTGLDAVLLTGYIEGGPLPYLEAMHCGLPVFTPEIGFAADFKEGIMYSSADELAAQLENFAELLLESYILADQFGKDQYVLEHIRLFAELLSRARMDLYSEYGMSRYEQLIRLIRKHKPKSIVEIGVWNGRNAVHMLQAAGEYQDLRKVQYTGFDLFENGAVSTLVSENSKLPLPEWTVQRILEATGACIKLWKGNTRDTLLHNCPAADFYFIDGGHSHETIWGDWCAVRSNLHSGSIVVFDDFYFEQGLELRDIGCNKTIQLIQAQGLQTEVLREVVTDTPDGKIAMVVVYA